MPVEKTCKPLINLSSAVFKFSGAYALHNEVPVYSIFFFRRYIAESCPFAIPFAVFCHVLSL